MPDLAGQMHTATLAFLVERLFEHCDLATDAHMVGNVRNCLLLAVPAEGPHSQVVCYKPQWLDWLPVRWTEFQHFHMVIMNGTARGFLLNAGRVQSSSCSDGEAVTFSSESTHTHTKRTRLWHHHHHHHGSPYHTVRRCSVAERSWPGEYLYRTLPFGHPAAQGPCDEGRCAPGQRCAQRKDHETGPQELHCPLCRWPHASNHCPTHQKAHHSSQMTAQQGQTQKRPRQGDILAW